MWRKMKLKIKGDGIERRWLPRYADKLFELLWIQIFGYNEIKEIHVILVGFNLFCFL